MRKIESARRNKGLNKQDIKYSNITLFKKRELRGFSARPKTTKTISIYTDYQKNFPMLTQTTLPTSFRNDSKTTKYNPIITQSNFSEIITNDSFYLTETKKINIPTISNISKINNISNFENLSFRKDNKNENYDTSDSETTSDNSKKITVEKKFTNTKPLNPYYLFCQEKIFY